MDKHSQDPIHALSTQGCEEGECERIDRFQALEPGTFWRAREDVVKHDPRFNSSSTQASAGELLLLLRIDQYEGTPHTIELRTPPSRSGRQFKMLVNDFLNAFEFEPDGEAIRRQELMAAQAHIQRMQEALIEGTRTKNAAMDTHVQKGLLEWRKEKVRSGELSGETAMTTTPLQGASLRTDIGFAIENQIKPSDVQQVVLFAQEQGQIAKLQAEWIAKQNRDIADYIKNHLTPFFEEQAAVALAKTSQIMDFAKEIEKGILSLNLYTGTGVEVEQITSGEGAPSSEPLTLMQAKLFADEELAVHEDVDERFDHFDDKRFIAALSTEPALRDQLLPFPRCVVSVATRRSDLQYEKADGMTEAHWNRLNKRVFLLVRNGDNLYRVFSGTKSHEVSKRLFPTKNEAGQIFKGIDGKQITFRDIDFTEANRDFENHALHYKRFLILLCGLDHRLDLFGTFYHEPKGLNFISQEFQARNLRFVADDEPGTLLADDHAPVWQWMEEQNAHLQSGSRVLCHLSTLITTDTAPSCQKKGSAGFLETYATSTNESGVFVVTKDGNDLVVKVPVERTSDRVTQKFFDARVSLTAFNHTITEKEGFGFLCLDAIHAHDLRWYVHNRHSRIGHAFYLRLFRRVLALLEQEEYEEAAARAYLREHALRAGVASPETLPSLMSEAILRWRRANRGAPLPQPEDGTKVLNALLTQMHSLDKDNYLTPLVRMEQFATRTGLTPLRAVITGKNKWVLYAEVHEAERNSALGPWGWVWRIRFTPSKTGVSEAGRTLVWLMDQPNMSERIIQEWPACASWIHPAKVSSPTPPAKIEHAMQQISSLSQSFPALLKQLSEQGLSDDQFNTLLLAYRRVRLDNIKTTSAMPEVALEIPIGLWSLKGEVGTISVKTKLKNLVRRFGTPAQKDAFLQEHLGGVYCNGTHYFYGEVQAQREAHRFNGTPALFQPRLSRTTVLGGEMSEWGYIALTTSMQDSDIARAQRYPNAPTENSFIYTQGALRPLDEQLEHWLKTEVGEKTKGPDHVWVAPAYLDAQGIHLEALLNPDHPD